MNTDQRRNQVKKICGGHTKRAWMECERITWVWGGALRGIQGQRLGQGVRGRSIPRDWKTIGFWMPNDSRKCTSFSAFQNWQVSL